MRKGQFYVNSRIFEIHLSPKARLVYFYLSKCSNRNGQCFPSKTDISLKCDLGKTSVASALDELAQKGLINVQSQYQETRNGYRRQTSNLYTLLDFDDEQDIACSNNEPNPTQNMNSARPKGASHPSQDTNSPHSKSEREINNKTNDNCFNKKVSSIYHCESEKSDLNDILTKAELDQIMDRHFRQTLGSLIKQMYYSTELKIDGATIPQELIRTQLRRIDSDTIAFACKRFVENAVDIRRGSKYLMACLYNAINDYDIDVTVDVHQSMHQFITFESG